jgi:hypothetical protein
MDIEKVVQLVKNADKARALLEQALGLLDVGDKEATSPAPPAKRRGRPRKSQEVDLDL